MNAATVGLSGRTTFAVREALAGRRRGWRAASAVAGPAVVASIAYMDPGNFATNIQAGAAYGYGLVWVVLAASAMAMLFQAMSAKIGIVTNRNLAELCREFFPRPLVIAMWVASEVAAMATDLAEFVGGAIGFSLLLNIPLLWGMVATGIITYAILLCERAGYRAMEVIVGILVGTIGICYLIELLVAKPDWHAATVQTIFPRLADGGAVTLAVGIIGATIMPHAIFLHSSLTQDRTPARSQDERRQLIRFSNREVLVALGFAALVNAAMVLMAAGAFHAGHAGIAEIETAYHTLVPLLGAGAAGVFLISLLASGVSSSVVGTMAGQVVMQGFIRRRIPTWVRRLVTMVPAFAVVLYGVNATDALIGSQIVLSLVLPVPLAALIVLSRRKSLMGTFASSTATTVAACAGAVVVLGLNGVLLVETISALG